MSEPFEKEVRQDLHYWINLTIIKVFKINPGLIMILGIDHFNLLFLEKSCICLFVFILQLSVVAE